MALIVEDHLVRYSRYINSLSCVVGDFSRNEVPTQTASKDYHWSIFGSRLLPRASVNTTKFARSRLEKRPFINAVFRCNNGTKRPQVSRSRWPCLYINRVKATAENVPVGIEVPKICSTGWLVARGAVRRFSEHRLRLCRARTWPCRLALSGANELPSTCAKHKSPHRRLTSAGCLGLHSSPVVFLGTRLTVSPEVPG
jgi:hypothetical protein